MEERRSHGASGVPRHGSDLTIAVRQARFNGARGEMQHELNLTFAFKRVGSWRSGSREVGIRLVVGRLTSRREVGNRRTKSTLP